MTTDEAKRLGGSAGLLGEPEPEGFAQWPAAARAQYFESYTRGRLCRLVAEGKAKPLSVEPPASSSGYAEMSRAQLAAEFQGNASVRAEFITAERFIAYATAEAAGKVRRTCGRVVSWS